LHTSTCNRADTSQARACICIQGIALVVLKDVIKQECAAAAAPVAAAAPPIYGGGRGGRAAGVLSSTAGGSRGLQQIATQVCTLPCYRDGTVKALQDDRGADTLGSVQIKPCKA